MQMLNYLIKKLSNIIMFKESASIGHISPMSFQKKLPIQMPINRDIPSSKVGSPPQTEPSKIQSFKPFKLET